MCETHRHTGGGQEYDLGTVARSAVSPRIGASASAAAAIQEGCAGDTSTISGERPRFDTKARVIRRGDARKPKASVDSAPVSAAVDSFEDSPLFKERKSKRKKKAERPIEHKSPKAELLDEQRSERKLRSIPQGAGKEDRMLAAIRAERAVSSLVDATWEEMNSRTGNKTVSPEEAKKNAIQTALNILRDCSDDGIADPESLSNLKILLGLDGYAHESAVCGALRSKGFESLPECLTNPLSKSSKLAKRVADVGAKVDRFGVAVDRAVKGGKKKLEQTGRIKKEAERPQVQPKKKPMEVSKDPQVVIRQDELRERVLPMLANIRTDEVKDAPAGKGQHNRKLRQSFQLRALQTLGPVVESPSPARLGEELQWGIREMKRKLDQLKIDDEERPRFLKK